MSRRAYSEYIYTVIREKIFFGNFRNLLILRILQIRKFSSLNNFCKIHRIYKNILCENLNYVLFRNENFPNYGISNISLNYSQLKSTRPVASKSKVERPGSGCGVFVGVSRNKTGVSGSRRGFAVFLFLLFASIRICNHIPKPHILKL